MFIILSIIKPYTIPKNIFINNIFSINDISTFSDIIIINISSLVDKYIDINVPSVIILVIYRLVAITEKPHCGITPSREPIIGPTFFDLVIMFFVLLFNLCSNNSIIRKATNKNGINFNESTIVSKITSFICYHSVFNYNINIILVQLYFIHFSFIRWSFW